MSVYYIVAEARDWFFLLLVVAWFILERRRVASDRRSLLNKPTVYASGWPPVERSNVPRPPLPQPPSTSEEPEELKPNEANLIDEWLSTNDKP